MSEPQIRPGTIADLPAVMEMFRELAEWQLPWRVFRVRDSLPREMEQRYRLALTDGQDEVLFVADDGGVVVGMAEGSLGRPSTFSADRAVELSSVYVRPAHRRRGIARRLTAAVAAVAAGLGVGRVTLRTFVQNEPAVASWEALGFEPRILQMTAPVERLLSDRA